ncbi:MAG TPA: NAD(P) transhydrogenase subunit alpha [Dysgonamonadaceae bacterium]|jgi:NAD(P) transhydrogenase subunit alpha|nr:NAD(P) transhydrogenase subunit alpha [Dysgonamonadaceae bacterium]
MNPLLLVLIFIVSSILGYFIIKNVPSLLHTPLMSGMNALSGISILGAMVAVGLSFKSGESIIAQVVAGVAIVFAAINVMGGFGVTHRMLRMFNKKKSVRK